VNSRLRGLAAIVAMPLLAASLAACNRTSASPPAATTAAAPMTAGAGCASEIARFQSVLKSDVETGNVNRKVYDRAEPQLNRASAACAAGRDGEAQAILASTKRQFGYP
jgi:curli biogenesis system outer membrane secretion channel CsgG